MIPDKNDISKYIEECNMEDLENLDLAQYPITLQLRIQAIKVQKTIDGIEQYLNKSLYYQYYKKKRTNNNKELDEDEIIQKYE